MSRAAAPLLIVAFAVATAGSGCITRVRAEKAVSHQRMAQLYFDEGDTAGAIQELQRSIKLDPYIPEAHHLLATCFFSIERYADAEKSFKTVVRLKDPYPEAEVNWGAMLLRQQRWEDAVEHLAAAADEPTYREAGRAYHNLGWAYYNLGRYEEARASFERVLTVTPLFCPSVHNLGMVAEAEGKLDEAEKLYSRAHDCNPRDLNTWMALGRLYLRLDRLQDARDYLDFVIAQDEDGALGQEALQLLEELDG